MKKIACLLLALTLFASLCACGSKKDDISEKNQEMENTETHQNVDSDKKTDEKHSTEYWAEKYETNRCPFTIKTDNKENNYYFRDGGTLDVWVNSEENVDNWYYYNGMIISDDGKYALDAEEASSLSSFCEYEAKPYSGETLSQEEREVSKKGVFHVINSYTPIRTNWGVGFMTDAEAEDFDGFTYMTCESLNNSEWITVYSENVNGYGETGEKASLWIIPHLDVSEYQEFLSNEIMSKGIKLGDLEYNEGIDKIALRTLVQNTDANGNVFEIGDFVLTYGKESVIVGIISMNFKG